MNSVLDEEYGRSRARERTIEEIRNSLKNGDLVRACTYLMRCVEMLHDAENRVMRVHAECVAMLEQAAKILTLDASLRPIIVSTPVQGEESNS